VEIYKKEISNMSNEEDSNKCEQLSLLPLKKMYYSIGEVCGATSLEPHTLRYWESEFPTLRPKKNRGGKRAYQDKDIEVVCQIKRLLYEEKYTINGARQKLSEDRQAAEAASPKRARSKISEAQTDEVHDTPPPLEDSGMEPPCAIQDSQSQPLTQTASGMDIVCDVKKELKEILTLLK
jgi:DNA-binding transcriptional MerR regulator